MATFYNHTSNTLISGTDEADTILNQFIWDGSGIDSNVTIQGNGGDDLINNNEGYKTYIDGGSGNDSIANVGGNYISILSGVGDDSIENFKGGNDSIAKNSYIDTEDGNDYIDDEGTNSYIDSGLGNDTVYARGDNETIIGNLGDDHIGVIGSNVVIYAGDGDDSFQVSGTAENVTVISGNGNDFVLNFASNVTIDTGRGNDIVYLRGLESNRANSLESFYYNLGDGNDTIWGYTTADTLNIRGASYSSVESGNDIIITVGEGTDSVGTITLVDAAGTALNVASDGGSTDSDGETTDTVPSGETTETSTDKAYDIAFLIDNTGSMWDYIDNVKNNVTTFTNSLGNIDYRLGLVEFGDIYDSEIKKYEFTAYSDEFLADLNAIELTGGADLPESGLEALTEGMTMNFRDNAEKRFIVVTDANYHNQGDEEGDGDMSAYLYVDDVVGALKEKNIIVDVVGTTYEKYETDSAQSEWDEAIAQATGGKFYDIDSDFPTLIKDIAGEITGGGQMKLSNWSYHFNFPEADSATPVLTTSAT